MSYSYEERLSDSPFIQQIERVYAAREGRTICPATSVWHMLLARHQGKTQVTIVGPMTKAAVTTYSADDEFLFIKFKLGTFLPTLPARTILDGETTLPDASGKFWLHGAAWQFPDFDNVETFVDRLVREEVLIHDPVVKAALQDQLPGISPRTLRHRFQQTTGITRRTIQQIERARRAAALLQENGSILDTVYEAGYFDQPHLTRSLKKYIGYTPAQLLQSNTEA